MKIISKFTDYYDQVAHTYGGGDPKIRWERREIQNAGPFKLRLPFTPLGDKWRYSNTLRSKYYERSLIVGRRLYTVFSEYENYLVGNPQWFLPEADHEIATAKETIWWLQEHKGKELLYTELDAAIDLCRLVGQPVFWLEYDILGTRKNTKPNVRVFHAVPILARIKGFTKHYPANAIYQDLSYVLGNLMYDPPDANPPVQVEEKVRWVKKGVDSKTSFRGK